MSKHFRKFFSAKWLWTTASENSVQINSFNATGLFLYLLKKSGNHWFSDAFRGCRKIVTRNELNKNMLWKSYAIVISLLWLRSISYWSQSIDLLCKSVGWFQYDREIRHKSVVRSLILFMNIILFDKTNN